MSTRSCTSGPTTGVDTPLPQFVRDLLSAPPPRGQNLHNWLYRTARVLHPYRSSPDIIRLLEAATAGEPVKSGEIEEAVKNSMATALRSGGRISAKRQFMHPWPRVNLEQREAIVSPGGGLVDLWEASPFRFDDSEIRTEEIIYALFPGNPLLCAGRSAFSFRTRNREELRGELSNLALIVPSPMIARTGVTKGGKSSEHTLAATGPRRFLVVEFDLKEKDAHGNDTPNAEFIRCAAKRGQDIPDISAALLLHLAERAPLALAVHSGGKSIHGWFSAVGRPEELLRRFMNYAVSLGADRALWTRSQFVRMPDGTRDNGRRQTVFFFNPEVI